MIIVDIAYLFFISPVFVDKCENYMLLLISIYKDFVSLNQNQAWVQGVLNIL